MTTQHHFHDQPQAHKCKVDGIDIPLGASRRISPCTSCTCTRENVSSAFRVIFVQTFSSGRVSVSAREQLSSVDRRGWCRSSPSRQHLQDPVQLCSHLSRPRCKPGADCRGHTHRTTPPEARWTRSPPTLAPPSQWGRFEALAPGPSASSQSASEAWIFWSRSTLLHNRTLGTRESSSATGCTSTGTTATQAASSPFHIPKHTAAKSLGPVWSLEPPGRRQGDRSAKTPSWGRTPVTVQRLSFIIVGLSSAAGKPSLFCKCPSHMEQSTIVAGNMNRNTSKAAGEEKKG